MSDHADLSGLQGGTVGEYYHMTSTENTEATQIASGSQDGLLSSTDWTTFNNKQDALSTGDLTEATSSILTILGGTGAVIGSGASIEVQVANTSQAGYLTSTDWNTFNDKSDYADPLTTNGDIVIRSGGATTRLAIGSADQVLTVSSGLPSWEDAAGGAAQLPTEYIKDLLTSYVSATTVRIEPGCCRSDDDTTDLVLTANEDAVITSSGAGGLDTGSESSSTSYHIWLIYNPGTLDYAAMISLSSTSPTMPSGYTKKRRVGSFYNSPGGSVADFRVEEYHGLRWVIYDEYWTVLSSGSSTGWTTVSCSPECPDTSRMVWINAIVDNFGTTGARLNENGASTSFPIRVRGYNYASHMSMLPMDASQQIDYRVDAGSDDLYLYVMGYLEKV